VRHRRLTRTRREARQSRLREQNVPIIPDVSGYLEEDTANELLLEVVKQLFAKEKRLKKPFLLVVEEESRVHPGGRRDGRDGEDADQGGQARPETRPRHRRDQPAPGRRQKDFITQCDWLCWHRLTWDNDTKVVGRILGSKYASAVEDLGDGEAFLMTDWDESIRRIQFHRKQTFDAGATPGLDDFERPELKSVSSDPSGSSSPSPTRRSVASPRSPTSKQDPTNGTSASRSSNAS